jgi:ATP-dependent Zn protease
VVKVAFSVAVHEDDVMEVIEMLVATTLIVSFVPIVSSSTELEYETNNDTVVVREAQSARAFASLLLSLLPLLVLFSAWLIFVLTFSSLSFDL